MIWVRGVSFSGDRNVPGVSHAMQKNLNKTTPMELSEPKGSGTFRVRHSMGVVFIFCVFS